MRIRRRPRSPALLTGWNFHDEMKHPCDRFGEMVRQLVHGWELLRVHNISIVDNILKGLADGMVG
jgi:hypothetical protein